MGRWGDGDMGEELFVRYKVFFPPLTSSPPPTPFGAIALEALESKTQTETAMTGITRLPPADLPVP